MGFIVIIDIDIVYENMFMNERFLSQGMFQAWFMVFKHEYGFIRACLWKKGFMVFYGFGSTELSM